MDKYFYYGFSGKYFHGEDIEIAMEHLSSGKIKGYPILNVYQDGIGFYEFIANCTCFIVSNKVKASKVRFIKEKYVKYLKNPLASRILSYLFSKYDDEYRVIGGIPLSMIVGIGLPMDQLKSYDWEKESYYKSQLQELLILAKDSKLDIVNTDSPNFPSDYERMHDFSAKPIYDASLEKVVEGTFSSHYYYHGLGKTRSSLDILFRILTTGGIKSKKLLGYRSSYGYNGSDYVSICKKYQKGEYRPNRANAFYTYVMNSFCLIISDNILAFKLALDDIQPNIFDMEIKRRVSDMFDEWQVKDQIPLSSIIGIGIPFKKLKHFMGKLVKEDFETLREIIVLARELELDIVDSSNPKFVEQYEAKKLENPSKVYQENFDIFSGLYK